MPGYREGVSIRKFLLDRRVLSAALGIVPVALTTRRRPLGMRVGVAWLAWAGAFALAVRTVKEESDSRRRVSRE